MPGKIIDEQDEDFGTNLLRSDLVWDESHTKKSARPRELSIKCCNFLPVNEVVEDSLNSPIADLTAIKSWQVIIFLTERTFFIVAR